MNIQQFVEEWNIIYGVGTTPLSSETVAKIITHLQEQNTGCTRSHPHDGMNEFCKLKTEIARLNNQSVSIDALYQARIKQLEEACKAAESALVKQVGADYNSICHEAALMCRKALSTATPDTALQKVVLEARIDELVTLNLSPTRLIRIAELRAERAALGK